MTTDFHYKPYQSAWDNNNNNMSSSSFDPPAPGQNNPVLSRSPTTYTMPNPRYSTQMRASYPGQYRSVPSYSSNAFQTPTQNTPPAKESKMASCMKHITVTRVVGLIVGVILAGIPLAVMATLYAQLLATSDSATTTSVSGSGSGSAAATGTTSVSLPSQCGSSMYSTLTDATRLYTSQTCCYSECISAGWYRISGGSGTRLATAPASTSFCGGNYPMWYNGSIPTTVGATTLGTACGNYQGNLCHPSYSSSPVLATNCGSYYVFYLPYPTSCSWVRYCTSF